MVESGLLQPSRPYVILPEERQEVYKPHDTLHSKFKFWLWRFGLVSNLTSVDGESQRLRPS